MVDSKVDIELVRQVVGRNLRRVRETSGLTQRDVSTLLGCKTECYYRGIEKGVRHYSFPQFIKICDCVGISPSDALKGLERK